jgi:restriction system protein
MPIPDFQTIMLPLLQYMNDGNEHSIQEIVDILAKHFKLSEAELSVLLPSRKQTTFYNRVGWARTYLAKASLLEPTKRSYIQITKRGQKVIAEKPEKIGVNYLMRYPEFVKFRERKPKSDQIVENISEINETRTPEEILEDAFEDIRENLEQELLRNVKNCNPSFFESLVVELLVKMGYGGSWKEAARAVGQSGDGGIDGIIDEDRLGLESIYIQAKKWEGSVGRPEIQKFVGALMGKKAKKGVFITTSQFSSEALAFAANIDYKIVLIDGEKLAEFMFDNDLGVSEISQYHLKRIDSDYFENN